MKSALARLLFSLALSGCALPGKSPPQQPGAFGRIEGKPDGERFLSADAQRARAAGAERVEVVAVEAGAPGDRIGGLLAVPKDMCVLLLARASDGIDDIDLFAFGDDGTLFGSDERPDKSPTILVCPPHPSRLYVTARIASGHGLVAIGANRVGVKDAPRVGRALAARGYGSERAGKLEAWPDLDEKLVEHQRGIGGAWQEVRRASVPLDARVPTRISAVVEEDRCLDVLIVPNEEVSHLDVAALDESGRIVGRALAHGRQRFLIVCSPTKAVINIEIRPQAGRGYAALVMQKTREAGTKALDARINVNDLAPVGDLKDATEKLGSELEHQGYKGAKTIAEGALLVGRRETTALELKDGCSRVDVVVGRPARGVEAWIWTSGGSLMAHQSGTRLATLFACGTGGQARLDLEPLARGGPFAIEVRYENDVPRPLIDHPLAADRLLARMVARGLIKRPGQSGAVKAFALSATHRETIDAQVPMGRCVDVTLALGPGASGAEVRLVDATSGAEIELARGNESAAARACSLERPIGLQIRAELRVLTGSTDALVATRLIAPKD